MLPASSAIVTAWLEGEEGGKEREALERRYGRENVRRLVRVHEEERENRRWMESRTMACTGCKAPVEKSHGCSHMTWCAIFAVCSHFAPRRTARSWCRVASPIGRFAPN